jgi:hypothetical protein
MACDYSGMGGASCILGPCQPKVELPEFEFVVVGVPSLDPPASVARMKAGDSISVYFVRRRWQAPCEQPGDTLTGGTWSITGPNGQFGDFSAIASVTPRSSTRAAIVAKSPGHFGIYYVPAANPEIPSYRAWQDIRFCPGTFGVLDIQVMP